MALGQELLTDGGFDLGSAGWTSVGDSWDTSGNTLLRVDGGSNNYITESNIGIIQGKTYRITMLKLDAGGSPVNLRVGGDFALKTPTIGDNSYDIVASGGSDLFGLQGANTGLELDDISVKEILPTTTVEVTWVDSVSAAATGNKIYRDDIEIADVANGIQFYSDPTAPAGTESKYEVQAHDGAGDETTQEVEGVNMDYITTA